MGKSDPVLLCDDVYVGYAATSIGQHLQLEPMEPTCPIRVRPHASSLRQEPNQYQFGPNISQLSLARRVQDCWYSCSGQLGRQIGAEGSC